MKNIWFVLIFFSQVVLAQDKIYLIGNNFGLVSVDLRDDLIDETKYEGNTFSYLNLDYFKFGEQNIFGVNLSYNKLTAYREIENSTEYFLTYYNYEFNIEYYKRIFSKNESLNFYLGVGQHGYYTGYNYLDIQNSYDMGVINLLLRPALEFKRNKYRILINAGLGIIKFGSRADDQYLIGANDGYQFRVTMIGDYLELNFNALFVYYLSNRIVISPAYRFRYVANNENEMSKILNQSWLIGLYYSF